MLLPICQEVNVPTADGTDLHGMTCLSRSIKKNVDGALLCPNSKQIELRSGVDGINMFVNACSVSF